MDYDANYDLDPVRFDSTISRRLGISFIDRAENDRRLRLDSKTVSVNIFHGTPLKTPMCLQLIAAIIAAILVGGRHFYRDETPLYASVSARTTEIGTLRSMGFGRGADSPWVLCLKGDDRLAGGPFSRCFLACPSSTSPLVPTCVRRFESASPFL